MALVLSDEVYEHIVFDGRPHASLLARPELAARSFVVSSFGKTYHCTGWKVGYCVAPPALTAEFRKVHQFVQFAVAAPMQAALAEFLPRVPRARARTGRLLPAQARPVLPAAGRHAAARRAVRRHVFPARGLLGRERPARRRVRPLDDARARRGHHSRVGLLRLPGATSASCASALPRTTPRSRRPASACRGSTSPEDPHEYPSARDARPDRARLAGPGGEPPQPRRALPRARRVTPTSWCCPRCSRPASAWTPRRSRRTWTGPTVDWMREEAAALGCVITGSLIVREAGRCYNRLVWARPGRQPRALRQAPPVPPGGRAAALRGRRAPAGGRGEGLARLPDGLLRPALSGLEPQPRRLRPAAVRRQLAAAARARLERRCCGRAPSRTCATWSA